MVTYKKRRASNAWIIGLLVFILAMTITFSDVFGLDQFNFSPPAPNTSSSLESDIEAWQDFPNGSEGDFPNPYQPISGEVPAVPEPTTLTLIALGCGVLLAGKRKSGS